MSGAYQKHQKDFLSIKENYFKMTLITDKKSKNMTFIMTEKFIY